MLEDSVEEKVVESLMEIVKMTWKTNSVVVVEVWYLKEVYYLEVEEDMAS